MKKAISIQCSSFRSSWRRMILVLVIIFVSPPILHAEIQNGSIDFEGRLRNYMVYLPNNYTGSVDFPLVIHLHSGGWTAQQDMNYIRLNEVAEASGFMVAYPSAISKRWNVDSVPGSNINDVGFIDALIDTLNNRYSIDPERIYACGYSRGGFLAYTLAFQLSHRIAAIASVGGSISSFIAESYSPVRPMPVLHIHGTKDTWVSINGNTTFLSADQAVSLWTNFNDCVETETTTLPDLDPTDGCTVEKTTYTACCDNCDIVYYKVIDGGHTWPGAGPPGYAAGKTNQDFDASVEIWNFFKNYRLITDPVVDFNGDGIVNIEDLLRLIQSWGQDDPMVDIAPTFPDGIVDVLDLEALMSDWGQEVKDPTLIAHWTMDETEGMYAGDSAGSNDATVMGNVAWQPIGGKVDGALEFDGTTFVVADSILNPSDGPFSVLVWVKGGAPGQALISQVAGVNWLMADPATGALMTELKSGGRLGNPLYSEAVISGDDWHRVAFVWDGVNRMLYADEVLVAFDTQSSLGGCAGSLIFGRGSTMIPATSWTGLIDDIRIYKRAVKP
jgi:polyhydroxybutyrate depolymerase